MNLTDLQTTAAQARSRWEIERTEPARLAYLACWDIAITQPDQAKGVGCQPTILTSDNWPQIRYLAACLTCGYVSNTQRDCENPAVEDALDHTHPGFRDVPILPGRPIGEEGTTRQTKWDQTMRGQLTGRVPADWVARCGPTWTNRQPTGTRHVPTRGIYGGYDLGTLEPQTLSAEQMALI